MTKKHYEMIAKVLAKRREQYNDAMWWDHMEAIADVADGLAGAFDKDNPKFDRDRFLKACEGCR